MLTELENRLAPIIQEYDDRLAALHKDSSLPAPNPNDYKNQCLSLLEGRMEALYADDAEYKECAFISNALKSGWTVSDIMMLSTLYNNITTKAPEAFKTEGRKILDQIAYRKIETLADRIEMARITKQYLEGIWHEYPRFTTSVQAFSVPNGRKIIFPFEYPQDKNFAAAVGKMDPAKGVIYDDIILDSENYEAFQARRNENARNAEEYVIEGKSAREEALEAEQAFVPNEGQRHNKMTIPASKAVEDIYGKAVYDEIKEMSRGKVTERTVKLHHSTGTKNQKAGHHVLRMEFAGTGGKDVIKHQHERNGGIDTSLDADEYRERYGTRANKPGSEEEFQFIHYKDNSVDLPDGSQLKKMRYVFGGPNLFNVGEYSVENAREYAQHYAAQFIKPIFDDWLAGKDPTTINIDINGHSRGAVTAGQTAKLIHAWVKDYCEKTPGAKDFYKHVFYDVRLYEPVPGVGTDLHLGHVDLSKIPNMNATVFCSLGIAEPDFAFPLQYVKGAKKLVLAMTDHSIDTTLTDKSQLSTLGDTKEHAKGYYDAETGEMYRGSGLSELPDGVYVTDEKHNLIRMTSYSQTIDLFAKVYDKTSPQRVRAKRIHRMVRDWFCENELEMSFRDDIERRLEESKNDLNQEKILKVNTKRIRSVKQEILRLQEMKKGHPSKEDLVRQNQNIIKACRDYLKDTTMPPYGETARKAALVADTLSFTMRENNQLRKEIKIAKGEPYESPLDDKIKAHQERLEKKEGYLQRKQELELKRLEQEKRIVKLIALTKKACTDSLDILDQTRVGKSNSSSYEKFHKLLTDGAELTTATSVNDLSDFLKDLKKASDDYTTSHDSLIGPITGDGGKRVAESKGMSKFGEKAAEKLAEISAGLDDKAAPLALKMSSREIRISEMHSKEAELKGEEKPKENKAPEAPKNGGLAL